MHRQQQNRAVKALLALLQRRPKTVPCQVCLQAINCRASVELSGASAVARGPWNARSAKQRKDVQGSPEKVCARRAGHISLNTPQPFIKAVAETATGSPRLRGSTRLTRRAGGSDNSRNCCSHESKYLQGIRLVDQTALPLILTLLGRMTVDDLINRPCRSICCTELPGTVRSSIHQVIL